MMYTCVWCGSLKAPASRDLYCDTSWLAVLLLLLFALHQGSKLSPASSSRQLQGLVRVSVWYARTCSPQVVQSIVRSNFVRSI
jgi:hypothetical protein